MNLVDAIWTFCPKCSCRVERGKRCSGCAIIRELNRPKRRARFQAVICFLIIISALGISLGT